jgi:tRNA threonylcarbamoyladenosine biosynthesis protein TsaE
MKPSRAGLKTVGKDRVRKPVMARSANSLDLVLSSLAETEALGQAIGRAVSGGDVLALIGELGVGKTSLVRGIATGLGAPTTSVSSPTFVLIHEYQGRLPLVHADLYRLQSDSDAESIGLSDYLTSHVVTAIEWADKFPMLLPLDRLDIRMMHRSRAGRKARLAAFGPQSRILLTHIKNDWQPGQGSAPTSRVTTVGRRKALKR